MNPGRVFLDTSLLQVLHSYGGFIYDGDDIDAHAPLWSVPDGVTNVEALREIVRVWGHGQFQLALSKASMREAADRSHWGFLQWANEMKAYGDGARDPQRIPGHCVTEAVRQGDDTRPHGGRDLESHLDGAGPALDTDASARGLKTGARVIGIHHERR